MNLFFMGNLLENYCGLLVVLLARKMLVCRVGGSVYCVYVYVSVSVQGQHRGHQCLVCAFLQSGDS